MRRNVILLSILVTACLVCSICTAVLMTFTGNAVLSILLSLVFCVLPLCGVVMLLPGSGSAEVEGDEPPVRKRKRKPVELEGRFVDDDEAEDIIKHHRMMNSAVYDKQRLDDAIGKLRSGYMKRDA